MRAQADAVLRVAGTQKCAQERRTRIVTDTIAARPPAGTEDTHGWLSQADDNHDTLAAVLHETLVARPDPVGVGLVARIAEH